MEESITDTEAYAHGVAWAEENEDRLSEHYSSENLTGDRLRQILFQEAEAIYPSRKDSLANDLNQTAFVAGATRHLVDTLPLSQETMAAAFDASLEMGSWYIAERGEEEALNELKSKSSSWWAGWVGDARPINIVNALSVRWSREVGKKEGRRATSKWEILIFGFGVREMRALATVRSIELVEDGEYTYYRVEGEGSSFDIMAKDVHHQGRLIQGVGDITG